MKILTYAQERVLVERSREAWGAYKAMVYAGEDWREQLLKAMPARVRQEIRDAYGDEEAETTD